MDAKISISRVSRVTNVSKESVINICITDSKYNVLFDGDMTLSNFARAVTGQADIDIEAKENDNGNSNQD